MVVACVGSAISTMLALVAAAHQTGGRVICILRDHKELQISRQVPGSDACHIEFVIGEAQNLLLTNYSEADFVLIDCNLENHQGILGAVQASRNGGQVVIKSISFI
ncbi:hypothetical protein P3X46_023773 [Hevea brasiliensis]|uniref:Uncharacterized protein n=1 Tax=Hevea brasiliensis TaxID=3981 RepID=A0ABQ9LD59_HEVBR|nr:uncharacterized protein LOC110658367 [Hevea brasiliensis]KAJ9164167.1 hypothetical protein P3X46_023773 [Hevea brasiliensis]